MFVIHEHNRRIHQNPYRFIKPKGFKYFRGFMLQIRRTKQDLLRPNKSRILLGSR